jgi:arginyl-tRNA synthetase
VQPSGRPEYGDYQANGVMAAAKLRKMNPRVLAQAVVEKLDLHAIASEVEIAGPGFINITIAPEYLAAWAASAIGRADLGVPRQPPQRVVIDYSSPNLAKEMHVGHLRSTIIGDALARVFRFLGHEVIAQNHVGDWGTQFGMLTAYMDDVAQGAGETAQVAGDAARGAGDAARGADTAALADLEALYRLAKRRFDADPAFADRAREHVVKLQGGDPRVLALWRRLLDISMQHCESIYAKLGVGLTRADMRGESAYNADLPVVVADLQQRGMAVASEGAQVVFLDGFRDKDGETAGYVVQKQDGGYLYSTTDVAALRYRTAVLHADRILYVVDARQRQHFQQLFALGRRAGYAPPELLLEHVGFGMVLGDDGRPFKTRSGDSVKLADLLAEAEERAFALVTEKNPEMPEADRRRVAQVVGTGAVKYFDLARNRITDYVFDWGSMLSFEGNTAPYLQYAYARVRSVCRRAGAFDGAAPLHLGEPAERRLALQLARFADAVQATAREAMPSLLCTYLYELAAELMRFYEACPVLQAQGAVRDSRLQLCRLTADTLRTGLGLLGIDVLEVM